MVYKLPGTVLEMPPGGAADMEGVFASMFLTGGLVLSQVAQITGLEPYTVQNWVKRGFLAPPVRKKYSRRQLSRIIIINMLKGVMPMEQICKMIGYINGQLDDESDDSIDDSRLYLYFLRALEANTAEDGRRMQQLCYLLEDYQEPTPGDRERVAQVLDVMLTAWQSVQLSQKAMEKMEFLNKENKIGG